MNRKAAMVGMVFSILALMLLTSAVVAQERVIISGGESQVVEDEGAEGVAFVRVAHMAENVPAVDVFVDGALSDIQGLAFGETTDFIEIPAGGHRFGVGIAGEGEADFNLIAGLQPDSYTTIAAIVPEGADAPRLLRLSENPRVRVAHLAAGAPDVDVFVDGELSDIQGLALGDITGWVELPVGGVRFGVGEAGSGEADLNLIANLQPGSWTTVVAVGSPDGESVKLYRLEEDYAMLRSGVARVSAFHGLPGIGPVNLQLEGGSALIQLLGFPRTLGNNDGFDIIEVGVGTYDLEVVDSATGVAYFDLPGTALTGGRNYFVAAFGNPSNPQILIEVTDVAEVRGF